MTIVGHSSLLDMQTAVTTALTGSTAFTNICKGPFDPAPLNQTFPYTAFGEHTESNWYQFQKPSKQIDFVMHIYSQQPTYAEAMNILDVICSVIEAQQLTLPSGHFTNVSIIFESSRKVPEPDGITRHIESRWKVWNNAN